MRLGCGGCLGTLMFLAVLGGGALAVTWGTSRIIAPPDTAPLQGTVEDGVRAQQRFVAIMRAGIGKPRGERVPQEHVLSEAEINAFLSRHLGAIGGVPFDQLAVRLVGDGIVEVFGRVPLRRAFGEGVAGLMDYLPDSWTGAVITVRLRGPLRLETETSPGQPKALRLDVTEAYAGQQRVPVTAVEWMLGPDGRRLFTRLRVPSSVESVTIERQRAVIRTLSLTVSASSPRCT
jgi:hypothetical protein